MRPYSDVNPDQCRTEVPRVWSVAHASRLVAHGDLPSNTRGYTIQRKKAWGGAVSGMVPLHRNDRFPWALGIVIEELTSSAPEHPVYLSAVVFALSPLRGRRDGLCGNVTTHSRDHGKF